MAALRSPFVRCLLGAPGGRRLQLSPIPRQLYRSKVQFSSSLWTAAPKRPAHLTIAPTSTQLPYAIRPVMTKTIGPSPGGSHGPYDKRDVEAEAKAQKRILEASPETVSSTSSVQSILTPRTTDRPTTPAGDVEHDVDMMGALRSDMDTIKDTFSLKEVPRDTMVMGLAGVVPYFLTSAATMLCANEITVADRTGTGFLFTAEGAEQFLHILEPLQVGYGAVILSFLGAIHWGMEFGGYGGHHSYRRYAIGVGATALAWPTLLLSVDAALIAQFAAFVLLYYADAGATVRGLAPPWYATYRFVLTFVVGAAICVSLVARSRVADKVKELPGPVSTIRDFTDHLQFKRERGEGTQATQDTQDTQETHETKTEE